MISVPIHNSAGSQVGSYEFAPEELADGINKQLLHDVVVMYEANRRVGTVQTKSRGMVAGSTKKIFRQKGTGRARMGTIRSPIRRGGGHAFGKKPRDFSYRLPRKAVRLATRMALLSKFLDNQVTLLDGLSITEPKTREVAGLLNTLGLTGVGCLLAIDGYDINIWKSARNIPTLQVSPASGLNAYDLLHQRQFVATVAAVDWLRSHAAGNNGDEE